MDPSTFVVPYDVYFLALTVFLVLSIIAPKLLAEAVMWLGGGWLAISVFAFIMLDHYSVATAVTITVQSGLWLIPTWILYTRYRAAETNGQHGIDWSWFLDILSPVSGIDDDPGPPHGQAPPAQPPQGTEYDLFPDEDDFTHDEEDLPGLEDDVDAIDDFRQ